MRKWLVVTIDGSVLHRCYTKAEAMTAAKGHITGRARRKALEAGITQLRGESGPAFYVADVDTFITEGWDGIGHW